MGSCAPRGSRSRAARRPVAPIGFTEAVPVELVIGSTVDLIIDPIGSDSVDTSDSTLLVRSR